ncbi:MAG: hypothetical protein HIU84_09130 [Acidobacteria bacterium]|nr:hypothetical protein [Acidobacteriota bacterium]
MNPLRNYWSRLDDQRLRLAGASMCLVTMLLLLNNPPGSTWNRVGLVFDIVGLGGLVFLLPHKKR